MKADFSTEKYKVLTVNRIDELFSVDIENGIFHRKPNTAHYRVQGKSGSSNPRYPYIKICIDYNRYYLHDVLWFYAQHEWPHGVIDHINGNTKDNRIINLRDVSFRENSINQCRHRRGRLPGPQWHSKNHIWYALIRFNGTQYHLGNFKTENEAYEAYCYAKNYGLEEYWKIKKVFKVKLISYHKGKHKWITSLFTTEGRKHVGYFNTALEAIEARDRAIDKYRDIIMLSNPLYTKEDFINDSVS